MVEYLFGKAKRYINIVNNTVSDGRKNDSNLPYSDLNFDYSPTSCIGFIYI